LKRFRKIELMSGNLISMESLFQFLGGNNTGSTTTTTDSSTSTNSKQINRAQRNEKTTLLTVDDKLHVQRRQMKSDVGLTEHLMRIISNDYGTATVEYRSINQ